MDTTARHPNGDVTRYRVGQAERAIAALHTDVRQLADREEAHYIALLSAIADLKTSQAGPKLLSHGIGQLLLNAVSAAFGAAISIIFQHVR